MKKRCSINEYLFSTFHYRILDYRICVAVTFCCHHIKFYQYLKKCKFCTCLSFYGHLALAAILNQVDYKSQLNCRCASNDYFLKVSLKFILKTFC